MGQDASRFIALLPTVTFTTAVGPVLSPLSGNFKGVPGTKYLSMWANFVYGSGGTNVNAYVQTSLDAGVTWIDIANFQFTTTSAKKVSAVSVYIALAAATAPGDGALTANTIVNGLLGDIFRVSYTSTGTYAGGTTLTINGLAKG